MPLHPAVYAELLGDKIEKHGVNVWLINTGWSGGSYGVGKRIKLAYTRAMIHAVLEDTLIDADYQTHPIFDLEMPVSCFGVPPEILDPRNTWVDKEAYDLKAEELSESFKSNFHQFEDKLTYEIK
jgi:phosphoenolpyruvate carboxykinase (ATP)